LNIHLENVNLDSNSGPNSFGKKLVKYMTKDKNQFDKSKEPDAHLCFIESFKKSYDKPMFQRLDGIYFNISQEYKIQNKNIKRTYDLADGVIFQSEFNKQLTFKYFGPHKNYTIIHNGADLETIKETPVLELNRYDNLWSCASSWRPHKRLDENIRYFLEHSGDNDGLMIAGDISLSERTKHDRIHYVGNLNQRQLFSLYKKSKYFIHLAWLDHCPNVVVDARSSGCQIICSSEGGTYEIAGSNAIVIQEAKWNYEPTLLYSPPKLDFTKKVSIGRDSDCDMTNVCKKYKNFMLGDF